MKNPHLFALLLTLFFFSSTAVADDDPCNFITGGPVYSYEQVMSCYQSVPFNHDDLVNAVESLRALRETSDLREVFETEFGWRERLAALDDPETTEDYPNDYALQRAIMLNHKEFYNPHWRYYPPSCYTEILSAFMPFDFGSTVTRIRGGKQQQIIFIEAAPFWPELYQSFTGIDTEDYVGLRVISINGVDPLDYFRSFGRDVLRFDRNDGENLNEILQNGSYSIRTLRRHDLAPDRASDTYVFEAANGEQLSVEMPWVFARRSAMGLWPSFEAYSSSSSSFKSFCLQPSASKPNPFDLPEPSTLHFSPGSGQFTVSLNDDGLDGTYGAVINWAEFGIGNLYPADDDTARVSDIDGGAFDGFPFLGNNYSSSQIWVGVDGYITFGYPDWSSDNRDANRFTAGPPRIAVFFTDLDTNCVGDVYADVRADRVVITWSGLSIYGVCSGDRSIEAQAVLHSNGEIELNYDQVGLPVGLIGIAEGWSQGPYNRIDYSNDVPDTFNTGVVFEQFSGSFSASTSVGSVVKSSRDSLNEGEVRFARELFEKRGLVAKLRGNSKGRRAEFFDVPPGRTQESLPIVVPKNNGAVAYQLDDTTIIRLDYFAEPWEDEVVAATNFACESSERLIIDLRNNGGGSPQLVSWLTRHLFPERTAPSIFATNFRVLRGNPVLEELSQRAYDYNGPGCWTGLEAECFMNTLTGNPMSREDWENTIEGERGGVPELLSPLAYVPFNGSYEIPGSYPIACPGKFRDDTLIVLSNGTGASAAHFFPEGIRNDATIVTMGGYRNEPLVSGIARGGYTGSMSEVWPQTVAFYASIYGPPIEPMPAFERNVSSNVEFRGLYDHGLTDLYVDAEPRGDVHINVWSDSPATDAFVYGKTVQAVKSAKGHKKPK